MSDSELQLAHPPRRCGDGSHCNGQLIEARLSELALEQCGLDKRLFIVGAVYECKPCQWKRIEPLRPAVLHMNGFTASWSPCRRKTDVQPV